MFSYFWCQTFSVSPNAPVPNSDSVRLLPDPDWCSGSKTSMECLTQKDNYKKEAI